MLVTWMTAAVLVPIAAWRRISASKRESAGPAKKSGGTESGLVVVLLFNAFGFEDAKAWRISLQKCLELLSVYTSPL